MASGGVSAAQIARIASPSRAASALAPALIRATEGTVMTTSIGILSTYPPTQCGLATFSAALLGALESHGRDVEIIAVVDAVETGFGPEVRQQWVRGSVGGAAATAQRLNGYDVAMIQHEYGIFGGVDGVDVLDVVRRLTVPVIAVLHTVLEAPTVRQRAILVELALSCSSIVTMTWTARQRLVDQYGIHPDLVTMIPHGASDTHTVQAAGVPADRSVRPVILTWGLIGEGKGIEWGIEAMALLRDLPVMPEYRIVGQTHPKVLEHEGERYRSRLRRIVRDLAVEDMVTFDARYMSTPDLQHVVRDADIVLLPYDSRDQVTSGVLVEAVTAGKPIISTRFPHAVELLSSGMGVLVERRSATDIADAARALLSDRSRMADMSAMALAAAPDLLWPAVAERYADLAASLVPDAIRSVSA